MKNRTIEEILNDRTIFTEKQATKIKENALNEAEKIWGGKRAGAGRPKKENVLSIQIRVSQEEKEFLKYARSHNLNYAELMQG